ncbi:MAG: hypothetical protein ACT4PT_01660 [Methanobacteriota archaeon]
MEGEGPKTPRVVLSEGGHTAEVVLEDRSAEGVRIRTARAGEDAKSALSGAEDAVVLQAGARHALVRISGTLREEVAIYKRAADGGLVRVKVDEIRRRKAVSEDERQGWSR